MMVLISSVVVILAGAAVLVIALRGRRIDDHPICRRCGFDLIGLPETSVVCSECGADLKSRRAIAHGHRQRRPILAMLGAAPLVLGLLMLGGTAWMRAKNYDFYRITPTWLLVHEARHASAGAPVSVWTE